MFLVSIVYFFFRGIFLTLEYTIKALKDENRVLKEKTTPTTGFNFRLFMFGIVTGIILIILIVIFIRV